MTATRPRRRRRWTNDAGNQGIDPVALSSADSADALAAIVRGARDEGLTARAVGSGHSWSDVALTTGYLVLPSALTGCGHPEPDLMRADAGASRLVSVRSGTTVRDLNAWLDARGLALKQMGGFDGQTIAGVASTSTHGSGLTFGPFPDYVRSVDLVDGTGCKRRIEPSDGPTDEDAFAARRPEWRLTKDDAWFDAAVCGMGCLGLIESLIIEVRESFELTEVRSLRRWSDVREDWRQGVPAKHVHYEMYINPYARAGAGSNRCIVTTRDPPEGERGSSHRPVFPELMGHVPWVTAMIMQIAGRFAPAVIPQLLDISLGAIACKAYTNRSYRVFNIGSANNLRAYSAEMAVPTADGGHIRAVEAVLETAERYRRDGSLYHTSPVALRFVAPSRALMSMMHDRDTLMIELIQLVDTDGGQEILAAHEERLTEFGVRPHWGQINTLAPGELAGRYPGLATWQQVRRELDPDGVFASPFSKRVGLTARGVSS